MNAGGEPARWWGCGTDGERLYLAKQEQWQQLRAALAAGESFGRGRVPGLVRLVRRTQPRSGQSRGLARVWYSNIYCLKGEMSHLFLFKCDEGRGFRWGAT